MEAAVKTAKRGFCSFYSKGEEIFNAVSHIVGGGLGVAFWAVLLGFAGGTPSSVAAVSLFGLGAVLLYTMSALYHFLPNGRAKAVFRIFDHCTIFLLIAGTYTPYCAVALGGTTVGTAVLIAEWTLAAAGVVMNAVAMNNKIVKGISMALYVVMGWMALVLARPLLAAVPSVCFWLLLAGGIAYTLGIVFFAFGKKVRYFHSVWHLFVIFGTALHFASILVMVI